MTKASLNNYEYTSVYDEDAFIQSSAKNPLPAPGRRISKIQTIDRTMIVHAGGEGEGTGKDEEGNQQYPYWRKLR